MSDIMFTIVWILIIFFIISKFEMGKTYGATTLLIFANLSIYNFLLNSISLGNYKIYILIVVVELVLFILFSFFTDLVIKTTSTINNNFLNIIIKLVFSFILYMLFTNLTTILNYIVSLI